MPSGSLIAVAVATTVMQAAGRRVPRPSVGSPPPPDLPPLPITFRHELPLGAQAAMAAFVLAFVVAACFPSALGPDVIPERGRIVCIGAAVFFLTIWGVFVWLRAVAYVRLEEAGIAIKGLFGPERNLPWDLVDRLEVRSDRQPFGAAGHHAILHTTLDGRHDLELLTGQSRKITPAIVALAGLTEYQEMPWGCIYDRQ